MPKIILKNNYINIKTNHIIQLVGSLKKKLRTMVYFNIASLVLLYKFNLVIKQL